MAEVAVPAAGEGAGARVGLRSVERALALPAVGAAVSQATFVYSAVRGTHPLVTWALGAAERTVARAAGGLAAVAPPAAGPLAAAADARLAAGLGALERALPLVKEPPQIIYETARDAIARKLQPPLHQAGAATARAAASLRELSWLAANEVLATRGGRAAAGGLDGGAALAHRLLDYYLPPRGPEEALPPVVSAGEQPALHSAQTVARLSCAAAWRVHAAVARRVQALREPATDPARYLAALVAVLHLTGLLRPELAASAAAPADPIVSPAAPTVAPAAPTVAPTPN